MCGCEHHWDTNAPCTCDCTSHAAIRDEMARRNPAAQSRTPGAEHEGEAR